MLMLVLLLIQLLLLLLLLLLLPPAFARLEPCSLPFLKPKWEFPKIGGTLFWGPYNKDPTIHGPKLGSPIFGNSQIA